MQVVSKTAVKRGIRVLGIDLGYKICGTFRSNGSMNFWNFQKPGHLLVIRLESGFEYAHLYLSVKYPESIAGFIREHMTG